VINEIIFLVLSVVVLGAATSILVADEPVHVGVFLGVVLGGVAGVYLTLGAEFLAAIQILIYVGAVVTLILFAVMLTTHAAPMEDVAADRTPLSALGFGDAPPGGTSSRLSTSMPGAETVDEAQAHVEPEEDAVRRDQVEDAAGPAPAGDEAADEETEAAAPDEGGADTEDADEEAPR